MKTIDCYWEKVNLNESCLEIDIAPDETIDEAVLIDAMEGYDYIVVKIDPFHYQNNAFLTRNGFIFMETQISITKRFSDFDFSNKLISLICKKVTFKEVTTNEGLNQVLESISPNMFTTDRIFLDPHYSEEKGFVRYKNWIKTSFGKKDTHLYTFSVGNKAIGFGIYSEQALGEWNYFLGGIYEKYQRMGFGLLTPASPFLYAKSMGLELSVVHTDISSNNMPVVKLYNSLNYSVTKFRYVFIKHK